MTKSKPPADMTFSSGFILIELLVVLIMVSIVIGIGATQFWNSKAIATKAAQSYVAALGDGTVFISCNGRDNDGDGKNTCITRDKAGATIPILCESSPLASFFGAGCEPKNFVNVAPQ